MARYRRGQKVRLRSEYRYSIDWYYGGPLEFSDKGKIEDYRYVRIGIVDDMDNDLGFDTYVYYDVIFRKGGPRWDIPEWWLESM